MSARNSFLRRAALRLHHDIDRQIAPRLAQSGGNAGDVLAAGEGDVDRDFVEQPSRGAGGRKNGARAVHHRAIERGVDRVADERGDKGHAGEFASSANNNAVLIAGPTASGKSALALELAAATGGVVINADSMQVYRDLKVITARPTPAEEARVPHRLYGEVDAAINFSAGAWVDRCRGDPGRGARAKPAADFRRRLRPLFQGADARAVGGAADYLAEIREGVRARLERDGVEALHTELAQRDPVSAGRLKPRDRTRIARALEVVEATGRSLTDWHRDGVPPLLPPGSFSALFLEPERNELYARIDARFDAMLAAGALEEVAALAARQLDPLLPAMKAHGVPALIRHLRGEITLDEAAAIGRADTRHYAKRQFTWFRHQLPEFEWVKPEAARDWLSAVIPGWSEGPDPELFEIPGSLVSLAPRNDGQAIALAWLQAAFSPSPNRRNPANLRKSCSVPPSLDFPGVAAMFHATFGKSEPPNA